jgi:hypothetical protein
MNRWSCHCGIPDCADGFSERRETKNDVAMISNCQPSLRAICWKACQPINHGITGDAAIAHEAASSEQLLVTSGNMVV